MLEGQYYKIFLARIAILVLTLMVLTAPISNWLVKYMTFLGVVAVYVGNFISMFVIILVVNFITKKIFDTP